MKATVLGLALYSITISGHDKQYIQDKIKGWKAIYKISKINTIFIIDMLQKIPLVPASVYVKESVAMNKTILLLINIIRNKLCTKDLSGSEKIQDKCINI